MINKSSSFMALSSFTLFLGRRFGATIAKNFNKKSVVLEFQI